MPEKNERLSKSGCAGGRVAKIGDGEEADNVNCIQIVEQ